MESLSLEQARKLILLSQGLSFDSSKKRGEDKTLEVMNCLGYVQIDTLSVVQRAHHHTLWSRNPSYKTDHLDTLVKHKKVFEYWTHAAAYIPMKDYRFSLPRKALIKSGDQKHWYRKDTKLMGNVIDRIKVEGPLMAKDFISKGNKNNGWGSSPTKQALENLFIEGELMICGRRNFHKIYDLTERVVPSTIDTSMPSVQEHGDFLVFNFLKAHGIGTLNEIIYLLKSIKNQVLDSLNRLIECKQIETITVNNIVYYTCSESLDLLKKRLNRKQVKILSPFDNLLIQRKRIQSLFDFNYLLECYVPAPKRQFGYFCLPILWNGQLVARADCKVDKKTLILNVINLYIEKNLKEIDSFLSYLEKELGYFASFNQCNAHKIQNISILKD